MKYKKTCLKKKFGIDWLSHEDNNVMTARELNDYLKSKKNNSQFFCDKSLHKTENIHDKKERYQSKIFKELGVEQI